MSWADRTGRAVALLGDRRLEAYSGRPSHGGEPVVLDDAPAEPLAAQVERLQAMAAAGMLGSLCKVLVADRWIRYLTIAWNSDFLKPRAALAYAREEFDAIFGMSSADWRFGREPGAFGMPQVVFALPPELLSLDRHVPSVAGAPVATTSFQLESVLMAVVRSIGSWAHRDDTVTLRHGLTHTAHMGDGKIVDVSVYPRRADPDRSMGSSIPPAPFGGVPGPLEGHWLLDLDGDASLVAPRAGFGCASVGDRQGLMTWLAR